MKQFLQSIIIESQDGDRRAVSFDPGLNVITGSGSKGKSAVLRIVEYCLGGGRCKIPVGRVQDFAAWYCLNLNVHGVKVLIGRRAPGRSSVASEEAYYEEGADAILPRRFVTNTSMRAALQSLGRRLKLPIGVFRLGSGGAELGRLEVPELLPLLLQPQNIMANSDLLFPIDDRSSRQRLQEIVEIVLGIVTDELLALRSRKKHLVSEKKRLDVKARFEAKSDRDERLQLEQLRTQAVSLGLLPSAGAKSASDLRAELRQVKVGVPEAPLGAISDGIARASAEAESQQLRSELRRLSRELERISSIRGEAGRSSESLVEQMSRLRVVDILAPRDEAGVRCPLCDSVMESHGDELLEDMRVSLDEELKFVSKLAPELEGAENELKKRILESKRQLSAVEARIIVMQQHEVAPTMTAEKVQQERLIGAIEHTLSWVPRARAGTVDAELAGVNMELSAVEHLLRAMDPEKVKREVQRSLSDNMTALARRLKIAELLGGGLSFDKNFLTIERVVNGRYDPLSTIGGAENHVMYHICATIALHAEFLLRGSPVPALLILDQPSQAYFPSDTDERRTDFEAVWRIYELLLDTAAKHKGALQIIALDHADFSARDERFYNVKKYDWHDMNGLI